MRAVVQGLDIGTSWQRYLQMEGEQRDARLVRKTITWIRDEFAAAARRHSRPGVARLIQIDVSTTIDAPEAVSLETFVAEQGLQEFSESEQLEAYQAAYGDRNQSQARRVRLIAKQLDALHWLEELVAKPPVAEDPVASWLPPDLTGRLEHSGIHTLRALGERINGLGKNWARAIPAIGAGKAERIVEWMHAHQDSIGIPIGQHVLSRRTELSARTLSLVVPKATAIVPLDKFIVPLELDGSKGLYRAPAQHCLIAAKNDFEAVLTWLRSKQGLTEEQTAKLKRQRKIALDAPEDPLAWLQYLSNTQRAYLKEAERFLLWAVIERKKALSSMTPEDCKAYCEFLTNPTPLDRWCAPRSRGRWSPAWRPFEGSLSMTAQIRALAILKSLFDFLVRRAYLTKNPWTDIPIPKARKVGELPLTQKERQFIETRLTALPASSASRRLQFALHLLYATGLRLSEIVSRTVDDLYFEQYSWTNANDKQCIVEGWTLNVVSKRGKCRRVPLPSDLVSELSAYLVSRGLHANVRHPENRGAHLIGRATDVALRAPWAAAARDVPDPKAGIAASTLSKEMKKFFEDCANGIMINDPEVDTRFAAGSARWIRHTLGPHTAATAAGTPAVGK